MIRSQKKLKNSKRIYQPNISILCSLFTLSPNEKLFKNLNVKQKFYSGVDDNYAILMDNQIVEDLYSIINKKSIRQLAYSIVLPLLSKNYRIPLSQPTQKNKAILLKKYFKKYRYTYYRYFFPVNTKTKYLPTNTELNNSAIRSLFLILGI